MRLYGILYSRWRFWAGSERAFAVGFVSQNSDICPIAFKPAPKDAGAAPASFEPLGRCVRQKAEFRDTNPTANGLSDPARTHRPQQLPPACWSTQGVSCWLCLSEQAPRVIRRNALNPICGFPSRDSYRVNRIFARFHSNQYQKMRALRPHLLVLV